MYSTLFTLVIKACAVVNSSLFSSKYFYFYNVEVVAKASSNFPQRYMILTCLALCKPLVPLVSHISALFFKQVPRLALFKIVFCPPSHPTGSFVFFNLYGCALSWNWNCQKFLFISNLDTCTRSLRFQCIDISFSWNLIGNRLLLFGRNSCVSSVC